MLRAISSFRGEAPRLDPSLLPDNAAQEATNGKLLRGTLQPWRQFALTEGLANPSTVRTIFLLDDVWLSWSVQVDVARGTVAGDTTFRTYLTAPGFYTEPRFTNYSLATSSGGPPFPVMTRPLGVPAPDSAPSLVVGSSSTPTIDISDSGDQLATSWITSGTINTGTIVSEVTQDAVIGNPAPSYKIDSRNNSGDGAYAYRNFGVGTSAVVTFGCDFNLNRNAGASNEKASWRIAATVGGAGAEVYIGYPFGPGQAYLVLGAASEWATDGSVLSTTAVTLTANGTQWYRMLVTLTNNGSGVLALNAKIYNGVTELYNASVSSSFSTGDYCGITQAEQQGSEPTSTTHYDNIQVTGSGTTLTPSTTATSYVYTFVDDFGEESAPSPVSSTILRPDGVTVTVTTPTTIPTGVSSEYGITTKRIYRAATGNTGTAFFFVVEIPLSQADYDDVLTDAELGEELPSELWALPPDDLEGILALPNGVMAGFSKNQLCLSAQNFPHAWPVEYRLNTDTYIVGIGNVDTTVVIGTNSFVYWAGGNDPANYSMAKSEVPYACVSKTSFAYLTGTGVVFAGTDGLMGSPGVGQVRNLTDGVFTLEQWRALNPTSIVGVAHNDIYWLFWESGSVRGCYGLDFKQTGFGVITMAFHASAAFVDPITDKMYLVLDEDDEPDDDMLPVPADPPHYIDGRTIYEFEGNPTVKMTYRYLGKLWLLEHPAWLSIMQVRADDYDNLVVRLYGDGVQIDEIVVEGDTEFTLASVDEYVELEYEILGTSTVRLVQGAEDVTELR